MLRTPFDMIGFMTDITYNNRRLKAYVIVATFGMLYSLLCMLCSGMRGR
jgi:hypothetical protein